jgi:osmoprotectant transport system permease protein
MTLAASRPLIITGLLLAMALLALPHSQSVFHALFPALERPVYQRVSFLELSASHAVLVLIPTGMAAIIGIAMATLITRPIGKRAKPLVLAVAAVGQTFPPIAVLAITIPILGYGGAPTVVALFAYALLPIVLNTVAGLEGIDPNVTEAADGMGLSPVQRLVQVDLPLAAPIMLAGIRTAAMINVGTATVGSTVGAATLGSPIIEGISAYNTAYVIQGAILVGLLAVLIDKAFDLLAASFAPGHHGDSLPATATNEGDQSAAA